jgi:hypothetical protein
VGRISDALVRRRDDGHMRAYAVDQLRDSDAFKVRQRYAGPHATSHHDISRKRWSDATARPLLSTTSTPSWTASSVLRSPHGR